MVLPFDFGATPQPSRIIRMFVGLFIMEIRILEIRILEIIF